MMLGRWEHKIFKIFSEKILRDFSIKKVVRKITSRIKYSLKKSIFFKLATNFHLIDFQKKLILLEVFKNKKYLVSYQNYIKNKT